DMTYLDEERRPVVCNISFFNKDSLPKEITSLVFEADGKDYHLNDVSKMFNREEYGELRITSTIEINELLDIFNAEKFLLKATIDSAEYTFRPNEEFLQFCKQFSDIVARQK
ncbi:MAG: hypothetical protein FWG49_01345, partial [Leptospirales bacterium]|nr:hypothetical protein [Leptospirales bacterium]